MGFLSIIGWGGYVIGGLLWLYGYLVNGTKSLVDWASIAPAWIADFMPNLEAEMGMLVMCIAMVPLGWNAVKHNSSQWHPTCPHNAGQTIVLDNRLSA